MKIIKTGCSRWVILLGKYAIKIPNPTTKRSFLNGLLANMQESEFSKINTEQLCPVLFCSWFGFIQIMPRCKEITDNEFLNFASNIIKDKEYNNRMIMDILLDCGTFKISVEHKTNSFGLYKNKIVAIDYGN